MTSRRLCRGRSGTHPFRIVHTGYLHTELGRKQRRRARARKLLGGTRNDVDILTRSHVFLLRAIDALLERRPELRGRIEVDLAGVQSAADHEVTSERFVVRMLGYLEHPESVALIRSADLLFLPMHDLPLEHRSTIVPGKTYEYLAAGPPILAAVPNGDARDILAEAGGAFLCKPSDEEAMTENRLEPLGRVHRGEAGTGAESRSRRALRVRTPGQRDGGVLRRDRALSVRVRSRRLPPSSSTDSPWIPYVCCVRTYRRRRPDLSGSAPSERMLRLVVPGTHARHGMLGAREVPRLDAILSSGGDARLSGASALDGRR